jgi:hypothetical protein
MKLPCKTCGAEILPATAKATGGECMACKQGIRRQIDDSKKRRTEIPVYDPHWELWKNLADRVYNSAAGFAGLNPDERLYYTLRKLEGEVYNGGLHQYFSNSSGAQYQTAVAGLKKLGATGTLKILLEAKAILFGETEPPEDHTARWNAMKQYPMERFGKLSAWMKKLDSLDDAYYANPDNLTEKVDTFAEERGLLTPFKR